MTATCPTTGLDANVCFGTCCIPETDTEKLRAQITEAMSWAETFDDGRIGSEKAGEMLDLYARQFAARQLREAADAADRDWFHAATTRALRERADALDGGTR